MINYALAAFVVAALGGLFMATKIFRGQQAPWAVSLLHAALGAAGLVLLIVTLLQGTGGTLVTAALVVLLVATLGGFYLASLHARNTVAPKPVVVVHATVAAAGVVTLIAAML